MEAGLGVPPEGRAPGQAPVSPFPHPWRTASPADRRPFGRESSAQAEYVPERHLTGDVHALPSGDQVPAEVGVLLPRIHGDRLADPAAVAWAEGDPVRADGVGTLALDELEVVVAAGGHHAGQCSAATEAELDGQRGGRTLHVEGQVEGVVTDLLDRDRGRQHAVLLGPVWEVHLGVEPALRAEGVVPVRTAVTLGKGQVVRDLYLIVEPPTTPVCGHSVTAEVPSAEELG